MKNEATFAGTKPVTTIGTRISKGLGDFAIGGIVIAIIVGLVSLTLARFDIIEKISGFMGFMMMLNPVRVLALAAALGVVVSMVMKTPGTKRSVLALVLSLGFLAVLYTQVIIPGGQVPPIHDITTDLDDTPQFTTLDRPATSTGPFSIEEWRAFHQDAYGDIQPILVDKSPTEVLANVLVLMEDRGWEIASNDQAAGKIEATAYAGYLKFRDDVVVEVTPVEDGSTRVDMRSVSQVGVSDLGYNAQRIRDFLKDLSES